MALATTTISNERVAITIRLTSYSRNILKACAKEAGMSLNDWIVEQLQNAIDTVDEQRK